MSSPSNLYAEKIFGEHPIALWALDDKSDYTSLIKESDRDISLWNDNNSSTRSKVSGGTASTVSITGEPFTSSYTNLLVGALTNDPFGKIECISLDSIGDSGINFSNLNQDLATFAIGTYVYTESDYLAQIEIGYEYFDTVSGENIQVLKSFNTSVSGKWIFVSETFDIPKEDTTMRLLLNIVYSGGADSTDSYHFYVNGLSMGQWSEEFNSLSLGSEIIDIPNNIGLTSNYAAKGIEAKAYGLQSYSGYYLLDSGGSLTAKNSGMPMVYGASNITILSPNNNQPSLIIPGDGFLNESGKYKQYTVEFWLRTSCDSNQDLRIFGPIQSSDGLYVNGPFITLRVGEYHGTYCVGEWSRPMLINIRYTPTSASLIINSEEVVSLVLDSNNIEFPTKNYTVGQEIKDRDWLGFYCYDQTSPIEIDCVAIYPYQVSQVVSKRRWVYGQGVEFPENINTAYSGTSVFIDYPFANYSNSYSYPDIGKWNQGIVENLVVEKDTLMPPQYSVARTVFSNKTESEWLLAQQSIQDESYNLICLKPNSAWNTTDGYLLLDNINFLTQGIKGFFGVFKQKAINTEKEILFELYDISTSNYLQISIEDHRVNYTLKYGSDVNIIYSSQAQYVGQEFSVGINFDIFAEYFGSNVAAFLGKKSNLKMYIGGNKSFENTFSGNIYSFGLCTKRNLSKISQYFTTRGLILDDLDVFGVDGGIPETQYWEDIYDGNYPTTNSWELSLNTNSDYLSPAVITTTSLMEFVASYTVSLKEKFENFSLAVSTDSYWEDYIPLTYLAKYVKDADDYSHYEIDFIQFNINYPAPSNFVVQESQSSWTYSELNEKFAIPVQRTYESLDNHLFTGYDSYTDLSNKLFKDYKYDTSNSLVRTYVSFQYLASGVSAPSSYFTNTISPNKDGIVVPGTYIVGYDSETQKPIYDTFENTKYEVVDNMIIYPPINVDFNELALVTHIEFSVIDIANNPVKIKKVEYASQALNDTTPNTIGTRFGTNIYPYKKSGVYLDYKSPNPFSIYKGSTPYLYMTRNSGIQLRGAYDPLINRGIQIPINESKADGFKVIAAQMAIRYDQDFFSYTPTEMMQIESKNGLIKLYLVANHPDGKRAKIYAINAKTGRLENGIAFYLNGKLVKDPNITVKQWSMLGIAFSNSLNFSNYLGAIRITGPMIVNTVSYYKSTNLQEVQQVNKRPWFKVKTSGITTFDWQYWDTSFIWNGVLVLSSTSYYGVSPEDIYKTYTGTNKIIVEDDRPLRLNSYEYGLLNEVVWQSSTSNAV